MNIGIMASGNLGFKILTQIDREYSINCIFTDKESEDIISFASQKSIQCFVGNPRKANARNFIKKLTVDILISINYLFIIEKDLISLPRKLAFNIHGSLLPKYRGRSPHVWSIINNEKEAGITAHIIDEGCDTGKIIKQVPIPIHHSSTGADLLRAYEAEYCPLIKSVLESIKDESISYREQSNSEATFFGKRTPDDGHIDWNWQKERIRNWVRAQAYPYPGSFALLASEKIIIDEIRYCNKGFSSEMENGLVLSIKPLLIKTPNGVVEIIKHRGITNHLSVGDILN